MHPISLQCCSAVVRSILAITIGGLAIDTAIAQSVSPCNPPAAGEYLLLVSEATQTVQAQLRQILPPNATTTVCQYLDNTVVRVGGFTNAENANSWAQYLNELGGMQAFVARPPASTAASIGGESTTAASATQPAASSPASSAANGATAYNPQALGTGYAVLVNYFNRPGVAAEVRQFLARDIGLASYNRNPYLLALYTTDAAAATAILQSLDDRGFTATIVDSRRVVLLTPAISLNNNASNNATRQEPANRNEASATTQE